MILHRAPPCSAGARPAVSVWRAGRTPRAVAVPVGRQMSVWVERVQIA